MEYTKIVNIVKTMPLTYCGGVLSVLLKRCKKVFKDEQSLMNFIKKSLDDN